jgi:hypothetical protein
VIASYSNAQFSDLLDAILPAEAFRSSGLASGKAIWLRSGNLWTLDYVNNVGAVSTINVKDARSRVNATLFHEGVVNIEAVLKAVGALSQ